MKHAAFKLFLAILLATLFEPAYAAGTRTAQEVLDMWSRPHEIVLFDDTLRADTTICDTLDLADYGCPNYYAIWLQVDTAYETKTAWTVSVAALHQALTPTGTYRLCSSAFNTADTTQTYGLSTLAFTVNPEGNILRVSLGATDTLHLKATLWMRR